MIRTIKAIIARKKLMKYITKVIKYNENFLFNNSKETYNEAMELINDSRDRLIIDKEQYAKNPIAFFTQHILLPHSYGIYINLLSGNLPSCFMELRLMAESLAKCIVADSSFPKESFFLNKLNKLENYMKNNEISISRLMKFLDEKLNTNNNFIILWGELSKYWLHTTGVANKVVNYILKKSDAPPWALVIPLGYNKNDIDDIKELTKRISKFRDLLETINKLHKIKNLKIQFLKFK